MRCDRVRDILMDYVADELPEKISEQTRRHIATCLPCQAELAVARKASGLLTLLDHQEEPQGIIRVPAVEAKRGVLGQRRSQVQLLGALLPVAIVVCIIGISVIRSFNRVTPVVHTERLAQTGNISIAPVTPHSPEQQSVVVHTGTSLRHSVRKMKTHIHQANKLHKARNVNRTGKPVAAGSGEQPLVAIAVKCPSSKLPTDVLPVGSIMMVSVKRPSGSEAADGSYSYTYRKYDPESGASIECRGSRNGGSIDIRLHGELDKEQEKGKIGQ
jgi:hypothetical protein